MMMIAARSTLDVEQPKYNSVYQPSELSMTNSVSPKSEKDFYAMSYPAYGTNGEQTSPFYRLDKDEDSMELARGRLSSSEIDRLSVNVAKRNLDGVMTNSVSIHTAGHRFSFDRFSNSFSQRSPTLNRAHSNSAEKSPSLPDYGSVTPIQTIQNKPIQTRTISEEETTSNTNHPNPNMFDDDDNSWKVCGVCNDKATGYHFNAMTCEGCKGFFRRSMKSGKAFTCTYNNDCNITKTNRRQCQACRLRKCIGIGMKRECIMSEDQIQQKKTLVLTNRIKRAAHSWSPLEMEPDQALLLNVITTAFKESNVHPDAEEIRCGDAIQKDVGNRPSSPCPSPSSSVSSTTNYVDMINKLMADDMPRAPTNTNDQTDEAHVLHFTDIMEFTIKQVIKFCKKIPTFMFQRPYLENATSWINGTLINMTGMVDFLPPLPECKAVSLPNYELCAKKLPKNEDLDVKDQIALLKSGCTEVMFIKANYTYDIEKKALSLGPKISYTRESFLQGGMSPEYADTYLKFHHDLKILQLDDTEMASLSAIALFSADRSDVTVPSLVENQQHKISFALNAYSDSSFRRRNRFANIMSFLPRLRKLNSLCTQAFSQVQKRYEHGIKPLVIETQPDTDDSDS